MSSSFSILPPELLCRVFEAAEDFSVVAALAQTARIFYRTWRENPTSICQAVAPRVISNLTDAERLLDIQEEAEAVKESQDCSRSGEQESKSIIRAKRLLFNAQCASAACDTWVDFCQIHNSYTMDRGENKGLDPHMRPSEIARFKHAFYCVWAIGVMATTLHLQDQASAFLDGCSPPELCRLDELGDWATSYNENDYGSLGLDLHDEVWKAGCDLVSKRWVPYLRGMPIVGPDNTPVGFFAFFDETQWYLDLIQELYERERLSNPLFPKVDNIMTPHSGQNCQELHDRFLMPQADMSTPSHSSIAGTDVPDLKAGFRKIVDAVKIEFDLSETWGEPRVLIMVSCCLNDRLFPLIIYKN